jgi:hypothetical protein
MLAGWLNRHQQVAIEYLREENRILREMQGAQETAPPRRRSSGRRSKACADRRKRLVGSARKSKLASQRRRQYRKNSRPKGS